MNSNFESTIEDFVAPNSVFINGIVINVNDTDCHNSDVTTTLNDNHDTFVPDPRKYGLPEDFIFIEHEWGSLFYKHLGKLAREDAKEECSKSGASVHLPIPRFLEENEFYRIHFGSEGLRLN